MPQPPLRSHPRPERERLNTQMNAGVGHQFEARPVARAGSRSRAGNAMGRARSGVLDGALKSVVARGTRATSMSGIAAAGGVAKATVYNHFRTKDDVLRALLDREVDGAGGLALGGSTLREGLAAAADRVAEHPAGRTLAVREPEVLAALVSAAPNDTRARRLVADVLERHAIAPTPPRVEMVLRTLASFLACPGQREGRAAVVAVLASALVSPADEPAIVTGEEP